MGTAICSASSPLSPARAASSAGEADFGPGDADAAPPLLRRHSHDSDSLVQSARGSNSPCLPHRGTGESEDEDESKHEAESEDEDQDPLSHMAELSQAVCRGWDSRPFGAFWVRAEATVRLPQDASAQAAVESRKGTVVAFDAEKCLFTLRVDCLDLQVARAGLHFEHEAAMGRVKAFNDSAGVMGYLIWHLGQDFFAGQLQSAACQEEELDKLIVFLQVTSFLAITCDTGKALALHEIAPPYARRLLDLKVTVESTVRATADMVRGCSNRGWTAALLLAASLGPGDLLLRLLQEGTSPSSCAADGSTALHFAVASRQLSACRALLDARADPNALRGQHGIVPPGGRAGLDATRTPIQIAACGGFVSGLRLLMERGADLHFRVGPDGGTPLLFASMTYTDLAESERSCPKGNALRRAICFLGSPAVQRSAPAIPDKIEAAVLKRFDVDGALARGQRLARKHFNLDLWQTVFCWMMRDEDLAYGQEGIVVDCDVPRGHREPHLSVEFAGEAWDFPEGTWNVKAEPPPQEVGGFRVGELVFMGPSSRWASEVTVLGPGSTPDNVTVRHECGDWQVVQAADLARDRSSIVPFRALEAAQQALSEAKTRAQVLLAYDRLTDETRPQQHERELAKARRLRELGAHRAAGLSEDALELQAEMRAVSEATVAALRATSGRLQVPDSFPPPVPAEVAIKGAKVRLHCAGSLRAWLLGQLEMEVVSSLLVRAGWEPPSLAFPLAREALEAAGRAAAHAGDPESFVEVVRFCTRGSGAKQGLYRPICQEALDRLAECLGPDRGKGYLFGPAHAALVDVSSPSFQDQSVPAILAGAGAARLRVDEVRRSMELVMKSMRKSCAGTAASSARLKPILRVWILNMDILEGNIESLLWQVLNRRLAAPVQADKTLAGLRSAASEHAQIYTEVANVVRRLQGISFKQPDAEQVLALVGSSDFAAIGKKCRAMSKDTTAARMREYFDACNFLFAGVQGVSGCACGFRASELANSGECPNRGLRNHIDFPPAACLPCDPSRDAVDLDAVSQYYFAPGTTAPFRHWALAAEIESCEGDGVVARTVFGELIQVDVAGQAEGSAEAKPGRTILLLYPALRTPAGGSMQTKTYELSACDAGRVMILDAKLAALLKSSDLLCEERDRPSPKSGNHRAAVVAALVSLRFRVFRGYASFDSLLQPDSGVALSEGGPCVAESAPADHTAAAASAAPADADRAALTLPTSAGRKAAKRKPQPSRSRAGEGAEGSEAGLQSGGQGAREPCGAPAGDVMAKDGSSTSSGGDEGDAEDVAAAAGNARRAPGADPAADGGTESEQPAERRSEYAAEANAPGWSTVAQRAKPRPQAGAAGQASSARPGAPVEGRPNCLRVRPRDVFFTHDSIKASFRDDRPICDTLCALQSGRIKVDVIPELTLSWNAESSWPPRWWTFTGNRRLWVFRQLEEQGLLSHIVTTVTDQQVPPFRLTTKNGGESVKVRGMSGAMLQAALGADARA